MSPVAYGSAVLELTFGSKLLSVSVVTPCHSRMRFFFRQNVRMSYMFHFSCVNYYVCTHTNALIVVSVQGWSWAQIKPAIAGGGLLTFHHHVLPPWPLRIRTSPPPASHRWPVEWRGIPQLPFGPYISPYPPEHLLVEQRGQ